MAELEALSKVFGVSGVIVGCIIYVLKVFAPMVQKHLDNKEVTMKSIAASLSEMVVWQRTIDLRLQRLEQQSDETSSNVEKLANAVGYPLPRTKARRQGTPNEDR